MAKKKPKLLTLKVLEERINLLEERSKSHNSIQDIKINRLSWLVIMGFILFAVIIILIIWVYYMTNVNILALITKIAIEDVVEVL